MLIPLTIAGGVALILFGVTYLRRGLDRLFGSRLDAIVQSLAHTRLRAFAVGLGVAVVAPSSTTVSMLAVQTVQAGRLSARQGLAIMLGADIGLTVTVQLLALHIDQYAPMLVLIGVALYQFTPSSRSRGIGQAVLALGFVFLGIKTIREGSAMIGPDGDLVTLMHLAASHPVAMACLATVATMMLQSSTATIALLIGLTGLTDQGIPHGVAIPCVVGANIGVAGTTLIIGFKQVESRRLAVGSLVAKAVLGVACIFLAGPIAELLQGIPSHAQRIAHFHTGFNVVLAILALPLVETISGFVETVVPTPVGTERSFGPRYIDVHARVDSVALALGQSRQEILHMSELVRLMLTDLWTALQTGDRRLVHVVVERDDEVDMLDEQVKRFLTKLVSSINDSGAAREQMLQLRYASELETTGDIIDKNLAEVVLKKISLQVEFSDEGTAEIDDVFEKVLENMSIAETTFTTRDVNLAIQLLRHKDRLDEYDRELRDRHFTRLNEGMEASHETSAIHLDLLTHLRRVNSAVSHVAFAVLQSQRRSDGNGTD